MQKAENIKIKSIEKNDSLRAILDSSLDGIMAFESYYDENGQIIDFIFTLANKEACNIINMKEEDLLGKRLSETLSGNFIPLPSLHNQTLFENYKEVVLTGKSKTFEFYFDSNGIKDWFKNKSVKLNNGFVCTFAIVTKEKYFQEKLKEEVETQIQKQTKQEQIIIQQSKMAALGEMIGAIAHNWRQPLNTVSLLTVTISERLKTIKLSKEQKEYFERWVVKVNKQLKFMSQTIDDFKNFYKPNEDYKEIELKNVIKKLISLLDLQFNIYNIKIKIDIPNNISLICLENQLQQALLNILLNSKDAILSNNIENGQILISARKRDSFICLHIQDNGGGIKDNSILERIFEPYFTTKTHDNGTGIGLYMTKIIIEQNLGGSIEVQNLEEGLEFIICLPL
jgi:signal transduction histidine kinase